MRRITIAPVRTWRYKRMSPCGELFNGLAALSLYPFWPGYIINMSGYDFRKGQRQNLRETPDFARDFPELVPEK
jgi:hypothetical protein